MKSEYPKEITEALERLHQLDPLWNDDKYNEYIDKLNAMYQEFCELEMEQNILSRRGECYYALEKYEDAVSDLTEAIELGGEVDEDTEETDDSKDIFTLQCLHFLGRSHFELSQWELALDAWERIESIHSTVDIVDENFGPIEIMYHKGRTLIELERFDPAIRLLKKVYEHFKASDSEIHIIHDTCYYLAKAYYRHRNHRDAISTLAEIDENTLDAICLPRYLVLKCLSLEPLRLNDELLQAAEQLVSLDDQEHKAAGFYYSAIAIHRLGDSEEAVKRLERAVDLSDEKDWVHEWAKVGLDRIAKKEE